MTFRLVGDACVARSTIWFVLTVRNYWWLGGNDALRKGLKSLWTRQSEEDASKNIKREKVKFLLWCYTSLYWAQTFYYSISLVYKIASFLLNLTFHPKGKWALKVPYYSHFQIFFSILSLGGAVLHNWSLQKTANFGPLFTASCKIAQIAKSTVLLVQYYPEN